MKPEVIDGVDMMIVRELTGGLYFGKRERFYDEEGAGTDGKPGQRAYDTLEYREYEIERIARQANKVGLYNALSFGDIMLQGALQKK